LPKPFPNYHNKNSKKSLLKDFGYSIDDDYVDKGLAPWHIMDSPFVCQPSEPDEDSHIFYVPDVSMPIDIFNDNNAPKILNLIVRIGKDEFSFWERKKNSGLEILKPKAVPVIAIPSYLLSNHAKPEIMYRICVGDTEYIVDSLIISRPGDDLVLLVPMLIANAHNYCENYKIKRREYNIHVFGSDCHINCPVTVGKNGKTIHAPYFLLPRRPYPLYVYLYAIYLHCRLEFTQSGAAKETRTNFGIDKFSHSTVSRALKRLAEACFYLKHGRSSLDGRTCPESPARKSRAAREARRQAAATLIGSSMLPNEWWAQKIWTALSIFRNGWENFFASPFLDKCCTKKGPILPP
jgi:hypothetical protein